jgi:hypothetical protein
MLLEKELDTVLQEIIARWGIPGMAVGIVQGDEIVYAKGFGVQSMKTQTPVTVDSIFCTASVSKCFVATAIMQLAERGQINLDAPLVQYLPYFQMDDERHRQILIRQILSHTSGMPDMADDEYDEFLSHPEWDDGAAERYTRSLVDKKLIANPGERFSYSNIAYNVLGDVIAKVSGKSFGSLGISVIVLPAVALLGGGSATAARTGGASRRFPESLNNSRIRKKHTKNHKRNHAYKNGRSAGGIRTSLSQKNQFHFQLIQTRRYET